MMRVFTFFSILSSSILAKEEESCRAPSTSSTTTTTTISPPYVALEDISWLPPLSTPITEMPLTNIFSCCPLEPSLLDDDDDDGAPSTTSTTDSTTSTTTQQQQAQVLLGQLPQFSASHTLEVLEHARAAWNHGAGVWPRMSLSQRCQAIKNFLQQLQHHMTRQQMATVLSYEIGKNKQDALLEFDRTMEFANQLIRTIETSPEYAAGTWQSYSTSVVALVRRAAVGIILALAPYNYPLNESYATILPALLLGNVVIMKIPNTGGLVHLLTMQAAADTLPPGTINFIAGSGRSTMPVLMQTGHIDGLAFIGGHTAADQLIKSHPEPHRLKVFLQLEAKNMGIVLDDVFVKDDKNDSKNQNNAMSSSSLLQNTIQEAVVGSLSYNGQRCTALKLFMVPRKHADLFVTQLAKAVEALPMGMPWQLHPLPHDNNNNNNKMVYSQITPLPNQERINYMKELLEDALKKGAKIINKGGGEILSISPQGTPLHRHDDDGTTTNGNTDKNIPSLLMVPAVLYPVTSDMKLYKQEQFGPLVPVAVYDDLDAVIQLGLNGQYGQQVSIFGTNQDDIAKLVDAFANVFGKINLNAQCGRSPDNLPFSGRRSSAMGVMSVQDILREFSVPTVVAYKNNPVNQELAAKLQTKSVFLQQQELETSIQ